MLTLDEIRDKLDDRILKKVAKAVDLNYNTIRDIANGSQKNPSYAVVLKLTNYFKEN